MRATALAREHPTPRVEWSASGTSPRLMAPIPGEGKMADL